MKKALFVCGLVVVWLLSLFGGGYGQPAEEITVSAAMSLKNAFEEAGRVFETIHPGTKVAFNFGASGDLARQIEGGAPVDVFASAAVRDMLDLEKSGLILTSSKKVFTQNTVVLIVSARAGNIKTTFRGLAADTFNRIVICNPQTSPAGKYAVEVLHYYNVYDAVKDRLIFAENVRQAQDYVARNEADAGIVFATDALLWKQDVSIRDVAPESSHQPVYYPLAVVRGTKKPKGAQAFVSFITSSAGSGILQKYGFKPVGPGR